MRGFFLTVSIKLFMEFLTLFLSLGLAINLLYVSTTKLCFLPELDCGFDLVFDFDDFLLLIDFLRVLDLLGR